jgi:hypothetical protein
MAFSIFDRQPLLGLGGEWKEERRNNLNCMLTAAAAAAPSNRNVFQNGPSQAVPGIIVCVCIQISREALSYRETELVIEVCMPADKQICLV